MGKAAALLWLENRYLRRHLRGRGMEIGALWRRFPVHPKARVWYVDRSRLEDLKKQYADVGEKIFLPDLVAEATELPVARASLDFLIASHVLEHLPFPLLALRAWYQALAPGGVLLLKVPDKRYTFDVGLHERRCPDCWRSTSTLSCSTGEPTTPTGWKTWMTASPRSQNSISQVRV
jgi:SAM-dependent methyltransferase